MSIFSKKKVFTADEQYAMNVKQQMKFDHKMVGALIGLMMDLSKTGRTVYLHDDTGAIVMNRRFAQKNNLKFAEGVDFYTVIKESELKELRDIKEKYMRMELENKIRKEVGASAVVQNQITQKDVPKKEAFDSNEEKLEKSDMNDGMPDDEEVKKDNMEKTDSAIEEHEKEQDVLTTVKSVSDEAKDVNQPKEEQGDETNSASNWGDEVPKEKAPEKNWAKLNAINKRRSAQRQALAQKYQNNSANTSLGSDEDKI